MKASRIFTETLRDLRYGIRRLRHQGGQYSGKTVNILTALATLASEDVGGVTTVTSMSFPHLKGGAMRDFEIYVKPAFEASIKKYHKTDHLYTFKGGHVLEFKIFENEENARGPKRNRLFVNEANKFEWMTFFHLDGRSDQTIYDYNPSIRFWAHENHDGDGETKLYISDHRDNPFLTEQKHSEIERFAVFKRNEDGEVMFNQKNEPIVLKGNYELWKVYARGLTGNIMGVIFPHWQMIEDEAFPTDESQDWIFSIDFGYTNDPTALIKMCRVANTLFIKEIGYEVGMSPMTIRQLLIANGYKFEMPLYCEHDPDMVRILRNLGIQALLARKGQGSINAGIELLNSFEVKYPASSRNLHRERGMYIWEVEKDTGRLTNMPVDMNNHAMDATRYGAYSKFLRKTL